MEHISKILPNVMPNFMIPQNSISPLIESAIAPSPIALDRLPYAVRWHIPAHKYPQAKGFIKGLTQAAGGYNTTFSEGNWWNPTTQNWVEEPILLVKSYMTAAVLQQRLNAMIQGSYCMGKELNESAIALEILSNNTMLIIPCDQ
jgi:hypothetical protein